MRPAHHHFGVCAIVKDEGAYLSEWIEFHAGLGCTKFFIYDNESTDDTSAVLAPFIASGLVDYRRWSRRPAQITAYQHCARQRLKRRDAMWVAFIDLDEFLVPSPPAPLHAILNSYSDCGAVAVHWMTFGSSGHDTKPPGGVVSNFTWRGAAGSSVNRHYKSIVNQHGAKKLQSAALHDVRYPVVSALRASTYP